MKQILTFMLMVSCITILKAQTSLMGTTPEQPIAIESGQSYLLPTDFSIAYFTFKSETDGILRMKMSQNFKIFGSDGKGEVNGPLPIHDNVCIQGVHAGEIYHFQSTFTWGETITMEVSFEEGVPYLPLALTEVSPVDGSTYFTTHKEGCITFSFNGEVNASAIEASLILPNGEDIPLNNYMATEDYNTLGTIYTLYIAETYNQLLTDRKLKANDLFHITLRNITSPSEAENKIKGELKVTYKASTEATKLTGTSKTDKLKSYYMPGDEEGIIALTFSSPITSTAKSATLSYGDREAGTWKEIPVPYTIDENILKWNIQGIHLNEVPEDAEGHKFVSIQQRNILDTDGQYIESNTTGSPGSINLTFEIELLELNIYHDFQPAAGSCIDDVEEIEIWISAGKYITFENAKITCISGGEPKEYLFPKETLRLTDDPYSADDLLIYIPIKDCLFDTGVITIELTGVKAADGTSPIIQGTFISEGKGAQGIESIIRGDDAGYHLFNLDGAPIIYPNKRGIYLKRNADKRIKKVFIH